MTIAVVALSLISFLGFFGLLIASGVWDILFLLLAALPLLLGGAAVLRKQWPERGAARRRPGN